MRAPRPWRPRGKRICTRSRISTTRSTRRASPATRTTGRGMDDKREETLAVVSALLNAAYARDVAGLAACYADDAVAVSPIFGELHGREPIVASWERLFTTLVDVSVDVEDTLVDGNRVAVFATLSTIDRVGWFGRAPTGAPITYRLVLMFTLSDGKVVRDERVYDSAGLLERLEKTRLDKELRTAHDVQRALVPRTARRTDRSEWVGDSVPCRAIGGDFFEFVDLPSGAIGVLLGDGSGKGPAAALLAALVPGVFAGDAGAWEGPAAVLARINQRLLTRRLDSQFATMVYGVLRQDGRFMYTNAGHNPPVLLSRRRIRRLGAGGTVVGALPAATFEEETVSLHPGDTLAFFTDGVTEARDARDQEFGDHRLIDCLPAHADDPPAAVLDEVFASVKAFCQRAEPTDDITVVVARFT